MEVVAQSTEHIRAIRGWLLMVDFQQDQDGWYTCHVHLPDGSVVNCTFDDDLANDIERALRHEVALIGVAKVDLTTNQLLTLHIGLLLVADKSALSDIDVQNALAKFKAESDTAAHFREAWREVMNGKTHPISDLWKLVDSEEIGGDSVH